ncbi:uncharacterized protein [Rutidosis leptorrhynchoides]|uniref:uncharacterized protein n=1 Tax=Rutidosis leptorrhynchoides TaxID=125765 RepID=UPI003A98D70C
MEQDETTAAAAWSRLQSVFQDNKNSRALYLHRQFSTIKLDDFANVSAYCQQLQSLADQLMNVGDKVSNERMVLQLIAGLNDNFDTVGTYFTQLDKLPSFYEARSKLILEETRKQKQIIHNTGNNDADLITTTTTKSSSPIDQSQPRYNTQRGRGNNRGHNGRGRNNSNRGRGWSNFYQSGGIPSSSPTNWKQQQPPFTNWGYQQNPWAQQTPPCPYPTTNWVRPNSNQAGLLSPSPHQQAYNVETSQFCPTELNNVLHTMSLNSPDETWYMDSGATSHMAANSGVSPGHANIEM